MEELISKIKSGLLDGEVLKEISTNKKSKETIEEYYKECVEKDRSIRKTQIGSTQIDKMVKDEKGRTKLVEAVRTPVNYAKKIVQTSVAFEFSEPVSLKPSISNKLTEKISEVWSSCRLDAKLQELKEYQRSETQAALLFKTKKKEGKPIEIKTKVLHFKSGEFWGVFDDFGDMILFCWMFKTKKKEKEIVNLYIYDENQLYKYEKDEEWMLINKDLHGFDVIPVVYLSQEKPEHEDVKELIDRYETVLSKLGASNNYSGSPLLFTIGTIEGMPDRDSDGKLLNAPMIFDEDEGKYKHGDAKFLTHDNAPKSIELEMRTLERLIFHLTSTPDISFESLKGIGNTSGVALELLFLESKLKAKRNEGGNRTDVQRIINVLISGITNTLDISLKGQKEGLHYDIAFSSVLPNDLSNLVDTLVKAVEGGIISREKAVELLAITNNTEEEIKKILDDKIGEEKPDKQGGSI